MKDKRIAFYSHEFRLCEWPSEPTTHRWSPDDSDDAEYAKAVTSAMENGAAFSDQNAARCRVYDIINRPDGAVGKTTFVGENVWQPKEGDNWPAPEGAEIVEKCQHNGIHNSTCISRKVAVLRSESVEKKEWRVEERLLMLLTNGKINLWNVYDNTKAELQSIADRLNQSTPKE